MDAQFWINAWNEGKTNFHQQKYNEKLLKYFPDLNPQEGQKVLVPLCGKSIDMIWLHHLKLKVHGVEVYIEAVKSFFTDYGLSPVTETIDKGFINFQHEDILLSSGDFFKLNNPEAYDLIYDRASLVALPLEMRKNYADVIKKSLKKGGKCLLITYEYDQSELEGPPFSVDEKEIHALYADQFEIQMVDSQIAIHEKGRLATLANGLKQKVYILIKK